MAISGAAFRGRGWFMVAVAAGWMAMMGGCGSSGGGGSGGSDGGAAGGHGGAAVGGAGGHGTGGAIDAGGIGGAHDAGITDGGGDVPSDGPARAMLSFTFDTDLNGFDIDRNPTTNPLNLGGISVDAGGTVFADFDSTVGMPSAGSAHVSATFTDYNQLAVLRRVYNTTPINITGETLTARVRLDAGPDGGATQLSGVARLFALSTPTSTGFYLAEGGSVTLNDNQWHTMTFRLSTPEFIDPSFDATDVVQIGVHIATPPPVSGDAAPPAFGAAQPVSIHIDTFTVN